MKECKKCFEQFCFEPIKNKNYAEQNGWIVRLPSAQEIIEEV